MLVEPKLKIIQELAASSTNEEIIWINGYFAGLTAARNGGHQAPVSAGKISVEKITILYGTETGNAKKIATDFAAKAKKNGIKTKLTSLDQYRLTDLTKEEYLFLVVSTQGEGEPPAAAKKFYDFIHQENILLNSLQYGVLALGDSSYPLFCKAGEDVATRLEALGGKQIIPLVKSDVDFEETSADWFEQVFRVTQQQDTAFIPNSPVPANVKPGKKLHSGTIVNSINLNGRGSNKETYHIEIEAPDVFYLPGDSVEIIPENKAETVRAILAATGINGEKTLTFRGENYTVFDLLHKKLNILYLPHRVVKTYAQVTGQEIPETRIDLLDLVKIYPPKDAAQFEEVLVLLEPISPRHYSIASSPEAHAGEIHLTVAKDTFSIDGKIKHGHCSTHLSGFEIGESLNFKIHPNNQFRLPPEDKDVIMIGPGTGIAPFRSFIAERDALGASGKNWLFFGDQHFQSDFLYQTELQSWGETGTLTRINTAFSRDQQEKIYVQHRLLQNGNDLFDWLENGAFVCICGAKEPMSVDVENTLLEIIQQAGNLKLEHAQEYLEQLKAEGRYLKDVY